MSGAVRNVILIGGNEESDGRVSVYAYDNEPSFLKDKISNKGNIDVSYDAEPGHVQFSYKESEVITESHTRAVTTVPMYKCDQLTNDSYHSDTFRNARWFPLTVGVGEIKRVSMITNFNLGTINHFELGLWENDINSMNGATLIGKIVYRNNGESNVTVSDDGGSFILPKDTLVIPNAVKPFVFIGFGIQTASTNDLILSTTAGAVLKEMTKDNRNNFFKNGDPSDGLPDVVTVFTDWSNIPIPYVELIQEM